jgi:hypothetical protein
VSTGLKSSHPSKNRRLPKVIGLLVIIALILGGFWLYNTLSEVGLTGLLHTNAGKASALSVRLKDQPVYKIKKKQELLGVNVVRIVSRQQPEEFLVVDGVSRKLVDQIYGQPVSLSWANLVANQFMKLRENGEDASALSVEIQKVRTLKSGTVSHRKQKLPYWQIEVRFKLSNESEVRYYEAGIIRNARLESGLPTTSSEASTDPAEKDTLVIGYAPKAVFQKDLVTDLMQQLSFERN